MTVATGQKSKKHVVLTKFWVWQWAIATPFCHKKSLEFRWNFVQCLTIIIALQRNLQRNPNEIPTKHFLWQNVLPHVANEIPTKFQRNLNDTFLSQNWLYPIYCKWRIIMLESHTKIYIYTYLYISSNDAWTTYHSLELFTKNFHLQVHRLQ